MPKSREKDEKSQTFQRVGENLYRYVPSGTYYAFVKKNGKQIRRSLQTQDRKLAERRLKEFQGKTERLGLTTDTRNLKFTELGEKWLELNAVRLKPSAADRNRRCVAELNKHFGNLTVYGISRNDCEEWELKRGTGIAASTFNKEREVLKNVLAYAVEAGVILDNPALSIKRRRIKDKAIVIPTKEQFRQLVTRLRVLDHRASEASVLVELLAFSGMRLGEAVRITWDEVDFDRGLFTVSGGDVGTKNHEVRTVPLFPALQELLERLKDERPALDGHRIIQIASAKSAIQTASRLEKLPHFTHHSLRHFFVSNAIEAGVDFKTIASWIGHKDGGLLVAKTYGHLRDVHSMEMAKRMVF